jgi:CrcB protein
MLAGALGTGARYGLTVAIQGWMKGSTFPVGTLVVNVVGSLLLAFIATLALHEMVKPELRLILGTGFLGAFTTFSTFELEAEELLSRGAWWPATVYIMGNLLLGSCGDFMRRVIARC